MNLFEIDIVKKNVERGKKLLHLNYFSYNGAILPPTSTRLMGEKFYENSHYYESSICEGERLKNKLGVNKMTKLLEIGCATGRMVIGLIKIAGKIKQYDGIDLNSNSVKWCNDYIARKYKFCRFHHLDIKHKMYHPNGSIELNENFRFPFKDGEYDLIYLHSIISNHLANETNVLSKELYRLAAPGGKVFLTAYIEENVPPVIENPKNYVMECIYPAHIVRYEQNFFFKIFTDAGFTIDSFEHRKEIDEQSAVYLSKPEY